MTSRRQRFDLGPLADFMAEDILSTPGRKLVDEVTEDCGDPEALAFAFDKIVNAELPNRADRPIRSSIPLGQRRTGPLSLSSEPLLSRWRRTLLVIGSLIFPNRLAMALISAICVALIAVIIARPARNELGLRWKTPSSSAELIPSTTQEMAQSQPLPSRLPDCEAGPHCSPKAGSEAVGGAVQDLAGRGEAQKRLAEASLEEQKAPREPRRLLALQSPEEPKRQEASRLQQEETKRPEVFRLEAARQEDHMRQEAQRLQQEADLARAALPPPPAGNVRPAVATPLGPVIESQVARANRPEQIRQAQTELTRLGCFNGKPDGQLNNATRNAVKALWKHTGKPVVEINISDEFLDELKRLRKEVCVPERRPAPSVASRPARSKDTAAAPAPASSPVLSGKNAVGF
jgi:hypothetical protein